MALKGIYKKYQNLYKKRLKLQDKLDDLNEKEAEMNEREYSIVQKLLRKYISRSKETTIPLPENIKKEYGADHITIEQDEDRYVIFAYSGPDDIEGTERYIPMEVTVDILFYNLKFLYNEI